MWSSSDEAFYNLFILLYLLFYFYCYFRIPWREPVLEFGDARAAEKQLQGELMFLGRCLKLVCNQMLVFVSIVCGILNTLISSSQIPFTHYGKKSVMKARSWCFQGFSNHESFKYSHFIAIFTKFFILNFVFCNCIVK